MKRNLILGLLVVAGFPFFSACDDDDPPPPAMLNFEITEQEVTESDGTLESFHPALVQNALGKEIEVKIVLDKPAADVSVISFSVSGTAQKTTPGNPIGDYNIDGNNITIEKGATEAILTLSIFEDFTFEDDDQNDDGLYYEDIIVTLESVISGPVQLGEQTQYTLDILEDDALIELRWNAGNGTPGDVDMDLIVWIEGEDIGASVQPGTVFEGIAIPGGFYNETYGFSYTYYSGTSDAVTLTSTITNYGGQVNSSGNQVSKTATYSLTNINRYDDDAHADFKGNPVVVQTMQKDDLNYINVSEISIPGTGSRIAPNYSNKKVDRAAYLTTKWLPAVKNLLKRK